MFSMRSMYSSRTWCGSSLATHLQKSKSSFKLWLRMTEHHWPTFRNLHCRFLHEFISCSGSHLVSMYQQQPSQPMSSVQSQQRKQDAPKKQVSKKVSALLDFFARSEWKHSIEATELNKIVAMCQTNKGVKWIWVMNHESWITHLD